MKPIKLLMMRNGRPDIFLPEYVIKDDRDWIPAHKRGKGYGQSIHDNLHNDYIHGVESDTNYRIDYERSTENTK